MKLSYFVKEHRGEKILHEMRRHPITFVPEFVLFFILLFVPFALYFMFQLFYPDIFETQGILYVLGILGASTYYLAILMFFFGIFIDYYLDVWVITNERIVDVVQNGLFSRSISEIELFRIQDVTTIVKGVFPTLFNYGEVFVTTASNTNDIIFHAVAEPNAIRALLISLAEQDRKRRGTEYDESLGRESLSLASAPGEKE